MGTPALPWLLWFTSSRATGHGSKASHGDTGHSPLHFGFCRRVAKVRRWGGGPAASLKRGFGGGTSPAPRLSRGEGGGIIPVGLNKGSESGSARHIQ